MAASDALSGAHAQVHETVLGNGLRVLVQANHTAPLASVWCWYRVGSGDESSGTTGVSHWVEHMNFKGSAGIPRDRVKGLIEQYGGHWNGYTWVDQTAYTETATTDALDHMLFIEAERMGRCLYHPDDCESERTVIISELQGGENDPEQLLDQEVAATALQAHPYRHPTIGWLSDLQAMSRDDLLGHYRRFYVPNNATLVVVGDVEPADVVRRAVRHFDAIPPGDGRRVRRTAEPPQRGGRRVDVLRAGTTAYLKLAFHAPAFPDVDFFPFLVLDAVLTGAKGLSLWASFRTPPPQRSTRLYRALVDGGLASSVMGLLLPTADPYLYTLSATVTEGVPVSSVEERLLHLLAEVRDRGVTRDEFARAKRQLTARFVFESDSVTSIGHQIGFFDSVGDWRAYPALRTSVEAVSFDDVLAVAAARLRPDACTVGVFQPVATDPAPAPALPALR
ncbi:MAG: M16 family metallopeptidase [Vicinamibacterales bacterium]